jgi:hypothetical protein
MAIRDYIPRTRMPRASPYDGRNPFPRRSPLVTIVWTGTFFFIITLIWWINSRNPGTTSAKLGRPKVRPIN